MKYPELRDEDLYDATIARYLKNWIAGKKPLGKDEKARLLESAGLIQSRSTIIWRILLFIPTLLRWLLDNILIGPADQPMFHSLSPEYAFSKSSDLTILLAKRGILQSLPIQLGVMGLLN
jgi:hypothetical protein